MLIEFMQVVLHLDTYLQAIVNEYATLTYLILFLIIFMETGIVFTPFLPGDSLLFAAGAIAATNALNVEFLFFVVFIAAVLGDTLNYHLGKYIGPKVFKKKNSILFHKEHLARAQMFYHKYGKKMIILARFVPVIRTFAPFVAGIGTMTYGVFLSYNIIGAALWGGIFIFGGFWFGNVPWVREHFGVLIIAIIILSIVPLLKEVYTHCIAKKRRRR